MLSRFLGVVVPDIIKPHDGTLGNLEPHFFLREVSRARTCAVLNTRPLAKSSSAFMARAVSLALSSAFLEPPLRISLA